MYVLSVIASVLPSTTSKTINKIVEKTPSKVAKLELIFFHTAVSCPKSPNRRVHVQNVAYRRTKYKTGMSYIAVFSTFTGKNSLINYHNVVLNIKVAMVVN